MGPVVGVVHEAVAVVVNAPSWLSCPYRNLWVALSCTPFVVLVVEAVVEVVRIAYLNLSLLAFAVLPLAAHAAASAGGSCWPPHKVAISQCQLQKCHNGHSAKKHLEGLDSIIIKNFVKIYLISQILQLRLTGHTRRRGQ
jgi:hypothetical protein